MDTFDQRYDMEIHELISQLLLVQQKRLVLKDELFSDESITNYWIEINHKGDLFDFINILKHQIAGMLSDLEE
jgi:hypothetical protein